MFKDELQPAFGVKIAHSADLTRMSFSGELDMATAADMRQSFLRSDVAGAPTVQVDLAEVTFVDSTCVGILVAACKRARGTRGHFFVTCSDGNVWRMLEVYGLLDYLQVAEPL